MSKEKWVFPLAIISFVLCTTPVHANEATGTAGAQVVSPADVTICIDLDRDGTEETCKSAAEWGGHTTNGIKR